MDDVTKKVLALDGAELEAAFDRVEGSTYGTDEDAALRRLSHCAPEALRLLLEAEWGGSEAESSRGYCLHCEHAIRHAPDCRWLALMVKAGLR